MSIVTMKKKTLAKYNNMSVNQKQFSLSGTHRSQGFVGQDTIARSLPRTPFRGTVAQGYGGIGGRYPIHPSVIYGTGVISTNNPTIVKQSVLNTDGMLDNKYRGRNNVVKKEGNVDYSIYLNSLTKRCVTSGPVPVNQIRCDNGCANSSLFKTSYRPSIAFTPSQSTVKNVDIMDQDTYIGTLCSNIQS